ncbi:cupin domain-containing protein [Tautonia plasticadhaerens]|uniref:Cupin domain protein n=1 Tax=Tautonia plasticadhaerens TaxID=2527974 RepID=A0A518H532_9BACT|nr:mannose-6-phosphate isomerase [Tautonia plasticadhaerens]QDV35918.1 hypothetical protein ElP_38260 [Tautonia plasticadhaerens]
MDTPGSATAPGLTARPGPGDLVRPRAEAPTVPRPCGQGTRLFTSEDGPPANPHVTFITDSVGHDHARRAGMYSILEGTGEPGLNDNVVAVEPGMLAVIEPDTAHRLRREQGVRTLVLGKPAWHPDDESFDDDRAPARSPDAS